MEPDADVAMQGHYINYKYVLTPLCRNTRLLCSTVESVQMLAGEAQKWS